MNEERKRFESIHGEVWDTSQLTGAFEVQSFLAPFCIVKRRSDGCRGSMAFQDRPRFYFAFKPV